MKSLFQSVAMLVFLLSFIGCTKEKLIIQEKQYSWKMHPSFILDWKPIYNSLATDNNLFLYGPALIAEIDTNQIVKTMSANWFYSFKKQPISKDFFLEISVPYNHVSARLTSDPVMSGTNLELNFSYLDTTFRALALDYIFNINEVAVINDRNQYLIPVFTREDKFGNPTFYQVGIDLGPPPYINNRIATSSFKKIIIENTGSLNGEVYSLHSFYGNFFVGCGSSTFLIRPDGTFKKVIDERTTDKYFEYKNSLYTGTWTKLYKSDDKGENWNPVFTVSFPASSHTFTIGNEAFLYNGDRIAQILIESDNLTSKELVNDGLEGNQITSVVRFKDLVYITTLSGVFYKPYKDFLTYKKE